MLTVVTSTSAVPAVLVAFASPPQVAAAARRELDGTLPAYKAFPANAVGSGRGGEEVERDDGASRAARSRHRSSLRNPSSLSSLPCDDACANTAVQYRSRLERASLVSPTASECVVGGHARFACSALVGLEALRLRQRASQPGPEIGEWRSVRPLAGHSWGPQRA